MDSEQYEELCRHFIAEQAGLPAENVRSIRIPNPRRPGLPEYQHQIDLYWETGDDTALYLNIANAKWRGSARVEQGEVLLLQQVCQQVAAHKAFMITNIGFTAGAVAAAKDHGIALLRVAPTFDISVLPRRDRTAIQTALRDMASQANEGLYSLHVVNRGLGFQGTSKPAVTPLAAPAFPSLQARVVQSPTRSVSEVSPNRSIDRGGTRGGFGSRPGTRGSGGVLKK